MRAYPLFRFTSLYRWIRHGFTALNIAVRRTGDLVGRGLPPGR